MIPTVYYLLNLDQWLREIYIIASENNRTPVRRHYGFDSKTSKVKFYMQKYLTSFKSSHTFINAHTKWKTYQNLPILELFPQKTYIFALYSDCRFFWRVTRMRILCYVVRWTDYVCCYSSKRRHVYTHNRSCSGLERLVALSLVQSNLVIKNSDIVKYLPNKMKIYFFSVFYDISWEG